ncbi:putative oxidoreductase [Mesorhizobium metallidurans STM 2683]|uniref:Putative oxidoreductase n=1 Tax=Mesorhizobium metallidurans STM 2683 TaxID=1297569 RepID=M5ELJ7_9HYPH|nr:FAD-dependent oxidoreductase [Mesorhizobium metallidurans]CCV05619.1 putative oxidoreductase [Mesorhizobium metallidurans STM 2683]
MDAELPGASGSCWTAGLSAPRYPSLQASIHAETVVVGAGIVGLTTGLRLREEGREVAVVEALDIGGQVTGRSTAKITTQHRLIYQQLIAQRGRELAQDYADANKAGCDLICDWVDRHAIACDFENRDAYVYTRDLGRRNEIEAEAAAARSLGFNATILDRAPLPFETAAALRFPDQAQFNPASYLHGLAKAFIEGGGLLFERSRTRLIDEANRWRVVTDGGNIHAENVIIATNMTVKSPLGMARRTQPRMHIAMAFRTDDADLLDGMFISLEEPSRSLRLGRDADGPLLVVLGPRFNTGQDGDVASRFRELEVWVRDHFDVGDTAWRWCNEDYDTLDRIAYVGEPDSSKAPGFYIATGFNAWGISNGTAAGMLICDLIVERRSRWKALYDPARPAPEDFHRDGDSQSIVASVEEIAPGHGGVIEKDGEKIAVYRGVQGGLHVLSAKCTHKGCTVTWNNADRTWDCPCHGSIFSADGSVIHGPAKNPLALAVL